MWSYEKGGSWSNGNDMARVSSIKLPGVPSEPLPPLVVSSLLQSGGWNEVENNVLGSITDGWVEVDYSAFKSQDISNSQEAQMSHTASFLAGNVSFEFSVSGEVNGDFLRFYIDGVEQGEWSGEISQETVIFPLSSGNHTLLWSYEKDGSWSNGNDMARVSSIKLPGMPSELLPPGSSLDSQFFLNTGGWREIDSGVFESNDIENSQKAQMSRTAWFAKGNISFELFVSSEINADFLKFYIDGVEHGKWSGEISQRMVTFPLSAGNHTLLWSYEKDNYSSSGKDNAKISSITLPGLTISSSGHISSSGVTTDVGLTQFTVQATDNASRTSSKQMEINVDNPLIIGTSRLDDGIVGDVYNQELTATGGYGAYSWQVFSGQLPNGLTLDGVSSTISGTQSNATYGTIIFAVSDEAGRIAYKDFTIQIADPLEILTTALPNGLSDESFSEAIRLKGGIGPFSFSYDGQLPAGLSLTTSTGIISGMPTSASFKNVSITVTDSTYPTNQSMTQNLGIRTTSMLTVLTSSILPKGKKANGINSIVLMAGGGPSPYQWKILNGYPPVGITVDGQTGVISGTPLDAGDFAFTIQMTDADGGTANKEFFWHISDHLVIVTGVVPDGAKGKSYSHALTAEHGIQPYAWRLKTGSMPDGLSLNESTGVISGRPTSKQIRTFTIEVSDYDSPAQIAEWEYTMEIMDDLYIYTPVLPNGREEEAYTTTLWAELGQPPYLWRVESGVLPTGLSLTSSASTAVIEGTPTEPGAYSFTIEVSDSSTPGALRLKDFVVEIYGDLVMESTALISAVKGVSYAADIVVSGGRLPYNYQIMTGSLPLGLALDFSSGRISGIASDLSQNAEFTVKIMDTAGDNVTGEFAIQMMNPLAIDTETIQSAMQWFPFEAALAGSGGVSPHRWFFDTGTLPEGILFNANSGTLAGSPNECGTFDFTVRLEDASPIPLTTTRAFSLETICSDDTDVDDDGMSNAFEIANNLDPRNADDAILDPDQDGLINLAEFNLGTLPNVSDSDGDSIGDKLDLFPLDASESLDNDGDGIGDNADLDDDNDGMPDIFETANGLDLLNAEDANLDPDGDGYSNLEEYEAGTNFNDSLSFPMCNLDIDDNGTVNSLTDGVLVIRHLLGLTGDSLTNGAFDAGAIRTSSQEVVEYLSSRQCMAMLDVDGNGQREANTDGILIMRFLADLTGEALVKNAIGAEAVRNTPASVAEFLEGVLIQPLMPENTEEESR